MNSTQISKFREWLKQFNETELTELMALVWRERDSRTPVSEKPEIKYDEKHFKYLKITPTQ